MSCSPRFTAGSPKASTPRICRTRKRCWMSWHEGSEDSFWVVSNSNRRTATDHHRPGVASRRPDALVAHPGRSRVGPLQRGIL